VEVEFMLYRNEILKEIYCDSRADLPEVGEPKYIYKCKLEERNYVWIPEENKFILLLENEKLIIQMKLDEIKDELKNKNSFSDLAVSGNCTISLENFHWLVERVEELKRLV
jgi:hypothetical protein